LAHQFLRRLILKKLGFALACKDWLSISVGTSSGFSIALVPEESAAPKSDSVPDTKKLSFVQRLLVASLSRAKKAALSLRSESLELSRVELSLSGVGFAIPSVTATILLKDRQLVEGEAVVLGDGDDKDEVIMLAEC
jgi:hypothetical protein